MVAGFTSNRAVFVYLSQLSKEVIEMREGQD